MTLRDCINRIEGLSFVTDNLFLSGERVRKVLLSREIFTSLQSLGAYHYIIRCAKQSLNKNEPLYMHLKNTFCNVKDISGTVCRLEADAVLDEVELFEIKKLAAESRDISMTLGKMEFSAIQIPVLEDVFSILDPDKTAVVSFYLYNTYSSELTAARLSVKNMQNEGCDNQQLYTLQDRVLECEFNVRRELSAKMKPFAKKLADSLKAIAEVEIAFAIAALSKEWNMVEPVVGERLAIKEMFNPYVEDILKRKGRSFRRVSIELDEAPTLLSGANMSGKSVVIKTLALIQHLFQFGFYVPAVEAVLPIRTKVFCSIGDSQSVEDGLSSFAGEMMALNQLITMPKEGESILVLLDEPARTTNPHEGRAIVSAIIKYLADRKIQALIASHYDGLAPCRRLRVRGFVNYGEKISAKEIDECIDYTIIEDREEEPPMEALKIATLIGVDKDFIDMANSFINR